MSAHRSDSVHGGPGSPNESLDTEKFLYGVEAAEQINGPNLRRNLTGLLVARPRWSSMRQVLHRTAFYLLPSFVQSRVRPDNSIARRRLHSTAWLDGMRGLAAFLVCIDHLSYSCHDTYTAWGATERGNKEFLKLPLVRFFYTGAFMVAVFFVISGYALSYKPVQQMRRADWAALQQTLASSVFRRALRLYLPCVASTLLIVCMLRLGLYEPTRRIARDQKLLWNRREAHPGRRNSTSEQLIGWGLTMADFVNPWTFEIREGDAAIGLDGHLWTIPVEFRASLILFLTQLGLSRLRPNFRIFGLVCLMLWAHQVDRWEMFLFYAGCLLAELDIARSEATESQVPNASPPTQPRLGRAWPAVFVITFIAGLYLGGQPKRRLQTAPGWTFLDSIIPAQVKNKQRYWTGWGAIAIIWSTSNHPPLQRIFTVRPVQYLGEISFPLYLMHGMIIHTVGYGIMGALWGIWGTDTWSRRESAFLIAGIWSVALTIWAADLFLRLVDKPTVRFARWLETRISLA